MPRRRLPALLVGFALAIAVPVSATAQAPADAIRTGGPSFVGDAKRAVVLSDRPLAGRRFRVTDAAGAVVLRARLSRARGGARPWRHAAIADLSAVDAPGAYRVTVAGIRSRRPWVVVGDGAASSAGVAHVLRFFALNSDGAEPSPGHGPSHLNDATIASGPLAGRRVDLTGGWMDAGDMMKFTQTTSFAAVALLLAARLDPVDSAPLRDAAAVGVRWLLKAHPAPEVFVSQVGEITADHDRDPAAGPDPAADDRSPVPALAARQALTGIGLDSGGRTAAALALAAQAESDPAAKDRLLVAARDWYVAAERVNALAPRLPQDPYPSSSGDDDMALAAVELYRAAGAPQDLLDAIDWAQGLDPSEPTTWDNVGALAAAELCGAMGAPAPSPEAAALGCPLLRAAAAAAARRARRHALGSPGGLAWGTTAPNGGSGAVLALAGRVGVASAAALARDARDWVMGRNPWGRSFIAGLGPGSPRRIHHWAVRRGRAVFAGAVVGGPTTAANLREQRFSERPGPFGGPAGIYEDRVANYVTSEPALDYAASTVLLLAAVAPPPPG